MRSYSLLICTIKNMNCDCSDWTEYGLQNIYIGCLYYDLEIQSFDFNDIRISKSYDRIELHFRNKNYEFLKNLKNNYKIRRIRMINTGIKLITNQTFIGMNNAEFIHLDSNQIEVVEENAFFNCSSVNEINLSFNMIKYIREKTFFGASKLLNLWLEGNQIENIERNSFNHLNLLKKISLTSNKIVLISAELFKNLFDLEELFMSYNKISITEKDSFGDTKYLKM